jgi:hypothetical protein
MWRSHLWEEIEDRFPGGDALSFVSAIFSVTEWSLFAQRYFETFVQIDESVRVDVTLTGAMNRLLVSAQPGVHLGGEFRSRVTTIHIEETVALSDLRTDAQSVARRIVRRLFEMFNWNDPREEMLRGWQEKLISGKL